MKKKVECLPRHEIMVDKVTRLRTKQILKPVSVNNEVSECFKKYLRSETFFVSILVFFDNERFQNFVLIFVYKYPNI